MSVPARLKDAKKDKRGYPIPFFIPMDAATGEPNFKYMDPTKQFLCVTLGLCMICGQNLIPHDYWYITGPLGRKNQCCSDPAMHKECAEYSLKVCPHMHFEKTDRTTDESEVDAGIIISEKPPEVRLINARNYTLFRQKHYTISNFTDIKYEEKWHYVKGVLIKDKSFKPDCS